MLDNKPDVLRHLRFEFGQESEEERCERFGQLCRGPMLLGRFLHEFGEVREVLVLRSFGSSLLSQSEPEELLHPTQIHHISQVITEFKHDTTREKRGCDINRENDEMEEEQRNEREEACNLDSEG